jgi:hypothetical protein
MRCAFLALSLVACACGPTVQSVAPQAAFDLDCPAENLELVEVQVGVVGVNGCGQRATYVRTGNGPAANWILSARAKGRTTVKPVAEDSPEM